MSYEYASNWFRYLKLLTDAWYAFSNYEHNHWHELIHMCWYILLHQKLCIEILLISKIFLWCSYMNVPAIRLIPFKQRINFWSWLITDQKSLEILNRSMIQNLSASSFQTEVGLTARITTVQIIFSKIKFNFLENW